MSIYVSFNDSKTDPTYDNADCVSLVMGDDSQDNPCIGNVSKVSVLPNTLEELRVFAEIQGWKLEIDSNGQAVLHTGITK
jgi:hypothetical protein